MQFLFSTALFLLFLSAVYAGASFCSISFNSAVETFCCFPTLFPFPLTPYTISQLLGLQDITLNRITQKHQRHKSIIVSYLFFISTCACRPRILLQPLPHQNIFPRPHPLPLSLLGSFASSVLFLDNHCHYQYHSHHLSQPQHPLPL